MQDSIKIFVGTCPYNIQAEIALEYSIRTHTKADVEIKWMRSPDPTFEGWNTEGWGTGFTPFRWIIPELCGFKGRAIYMDVDVLVIDDIEKLWNSDIPSEKILLSRPEQYSVMLMDCERFKKLSCLKDLEDFKKNSCSPPFKGVVNSYISEIESRELVAPLDLNWNCLDGEGFTEQTKLIHYTQKDTQPWAPYPFKWNYREHPHRQVAELWHQYYLEAMRQFNREKLT